MPIVHGRALTDSDVRAVVVDRSTALALFGQERVVGQTLELESFVAGSDTQVSNNLLIVGVAADTDLRSVGSRSPELGVAYLPFDPRLGPSVVFAVRAHANPAPLVSVIRQTIATIDPDLAVRISGTGLGLGGGNQQFYEIAGGVTSLLGSFAWVLALVGLYGVLSNVVVRRTREIGVRVALGATPGVVVRMVIREGLSPVAVGIVGGLALGAIARLSLQPNFQRIVPPLDYGALAVAPLMFLAAALLACYLPARRASHIDPNTALRVP